MFEVLQSDAGRAHVKAINTAAYVLLDEYDALSHLLIAVAPGKEATCRTDNVRPRVQRRNPAPNN